MKVGRWAPVLLVVFGIAAACSNDSETTWNEPVGGTAGALSGSAGRPNQVGGSGVGGTGAGGTSAGGTSAGGTGAGGGTEPRAGAAGSPTAGAGGAEAGAGGEPQGGAGAAGAPPLVEGGAGGEAGGAGAGGSGGEGGAEPLDCEDNAAPPTQLPSCDPAVGDDKDKCGQCLKAKCCAEWQACYGKAPQNKCGYGGKKGEPGELDCIHQCFLKGAASSPDLDQLLDDCATTCVGACVFVTTETNDVLACASDRCLDECLPAE